MNNRFDFKDSFPPPETKPVKRPPVPRKGIESYEAQQRHAESTKLLPLPTGPDWMD